MDGTRRSRIKRGLRVAIVQKQDQPTGRRTIGEVADILTSSEQHPRGIKVRLKDGRVGRVQEILPAVEAARAVVLVVRAADGSYYARAVDDGSGRKLTALGLDALVPHGESPDETARKLSGAAGAGPPRRLWQSKLEIDTGALELHAYLCKGANISDPQAAQWDWSGWLPNEELRRLAAAGALSAESHALLEALTKAES